MRQSEADDVHDRVESPDLMEADGVERRSVDLGFAFCERRKDRECEIGAWLIEPVISRCAFKKRDDIAKCPMAVAVLTGMVVMPKMVVSMVVVIVRTVVMVIMSVVIMVVIMMTVALAVSSSWKGICVVLADVEVDLCRLDPRAEGEFQFAPPTGL